MSSVVGEVVYVHKGDAPSKEGVFQREPTYRVSFFYTIYSHLGLISLVVSSTNGI